MVEIPKQNPIKEALDALPRHRGVTIKYNVEIPTHDRHYMGLSGIGHKCLRYLKYAFLRAFESEYDRRVERIFNTGHIAEEFIIQDLEAIGAKVTNRQREVIGFAGHWKGHIDGEISNLPSCEKTEHLGEFKTHNDKNFNALVKDGVMLAFPAHYDQMTSYMGYAGLKRGLYIGYNKNTSEYYVERIYFNADRFKELKEKEMHVIMEPLAPKIGTGKPTWHECRFCDAKKICHYNEPPVPNCKNCQFVDIEDDGVWSCSKGQPDTAKGNYTPCTLYELCEELKDDKGDI